MFENQPNIKEADTVETSTIGGHIAKCADLTDEFSDNILKIINDYRKSNGLNELAKDSTLDRMARERAVEQSYYVETTGETGHDGVYDGERKGVILSENLFEATKIYYTWIELDFLA